MFIEKIDCSDKNKFFKNFRNWVSIDISRKLLTLDLSPDLYMGIVFAIFNEAEKIP